jgi:hypothetical protein
MKEYKMKGYKDYMNTQTVDPIINEKIMRKVTQSPKPIYQKRLVVRYAMAAACAAVLVFGLWAVPNFFNNQNIINDPNGFFADLPSDPQNAGNNGYVSNEETSKMQPPELQFAVYALAFNGIQNEMSASRIMPDFAHDLTDEQFNAIFPTLDRSRFEAIVSYWLPRGEYFSGLAEVSAHDPNGQASITAAEGVISFINPLAQPTDLQISYVHGVEVTAIMGEAYPMYAVRAEFVLGGIGYNVRYFDYDREVAKERLTAVVNRIIYGGAPDWSVLADPIVPELRNEEMTLEQSRIDPDFGAFMPINIPQGFIFDSGRRTLNQWDNSIRANWHRFPAFDNIFWTVAEPHEFDLERIVSANDRHKFDVSLYSIPWMDSVPSEIIDYLHNPVFLAEEMSLEIVQARAQWDAGRHGESAGWRIVPFGVLHGDVIIRISASGVSPEQIWAMLPYVVLCLLF